MGLPKMIADGDDDKSNDYLGDHDDDDDYDDGRIEAAI